MTSGGAGDDILQAHNIEYEDLNFNNIFANPFQILTGRGGDDLFHIENGAYFVFGGAGDDVITIGDDDFVFATIMGDETSVWSDEELASRSCRYS